MIGKTGEQVLKEYEAAEKDMARLSSILMAYFLKIG